MTSPDTVIWLQERTALGVLSGEVLDAIAQVLEEISLPENYLLVTEDTPPEALYILKQGKLESYRTHQNSIAAAACSFLPGTVVHLQELLLDQPAQRTIKTITESQFWVIPAAQFKQIVAQHPEIAQVFSRQLVQEVAQLTSALSYEQERSQALRPYLVTKAQRGIVGTSRYAVRLRAAIREASLDRNSVLIFGEPGLEKDNIAALIHFGSPQRKQPIIKLNCSILQSSGADLFGRASGKVGLLEWLGDGTLVLNNLQDLPTELIPSLVQLLKTGTYTPVSRPGESTPAPRISRARILMISERTQSTIERCTGQIIKVPPLRVRKADIKAQAEYYISLYCRSQGIPKPKITPEALRRLQSYDFPGNLRELQSLVERAIVQSAGGLELTEEIFWSAQTKKKQFRVNLLNMYPGLRRFLRSPWYPDRINYGFTLWFFAVVVVVLFVGPQHRSENFALNMFWAWWWPLILLGFPFLGRIWCAFCPFMIYGELTQKLSLWLFPRQLKSWPRHQAEKWGGWFLFGLFTLIFLWEELWHLEDTAYLSSCLLLLITAGAMIFSAIFERRFWCRYLCPIGGMNGLFAKLSMIELRAQQGTCSAECTTYQCYKGGPQKGEGMETNGCPLYSHPAQLEDNRDCVLCMTCLKACPHRSVEVNLRPPGIELWTTHVPRSYEVALLFLLFGGVFLHRLPELQATLGWDLNLTQFLPHLGVSLIALVIPASVALFVYGLMQLFYLFSNFVKQAKSKIIPKPKPFLEIAYGYLPLVLGGNLAHYLRLGLGEAGRIVPVTLATFGYSGQGMPIVVAHPAVTAFLQGVTLIFSVLLTIFLTHKITRQPLRLLLPQHLGAIALTAMMWILVVGW
ncbi:cyclic nucleotide-binding domain-containing protein [Chroococcidiopsis sp. TS-821]|uniref:cyclic nucleotide-binding domain-containing protein n=1 Tax=Chroococcidiopsis sp. TS-821 TaxID=1378066 RepID=UPI000CEE15BA|nr:cyclic nucleotide-binding domain-containing protein [Chroococcidiopsis sp. TS-821]PPS43266.1 AAA family ATPase [Chroococcidiopsis sp. TS-821]